MASNESQMEVGYQTAINKLGKRATMSSSWTSCWSTVTFPWTSYWCSSDERRRGWGRRWKAGSVKNNRNLSDRCPALIPAIRVETGRKRFLCMSECLRFSHWTMLSFIFNTARWFHITVTHFVVSKLSWKAVHANTHICFYWTPYVVHYKIIVLSQRYSKQTSVESVLRITDGSVSHKNLLISLLALGCLVRCGAMLTNISIMYKMSKSV